MRNKKKQTIKAIKISVGNNDNHNNENKRNSNKNNNDNSNNNGLKDGQNGRLEKKETLIRTFDKNFIKALFVLKIFKLFS